MATSFTAGALRRAEYNIKRATAVSAYENARRKEAEDEKNRGGLFGGIGYLGEKFGLGFLQSVEGIADFTVGGLAKLFGADDWAEEIMSSDWVDYTHADDWFNPDSAWSVAGDVAGGIGTSVPAIATAVGITLASGGTAAPLAVGLASGGVAGLGAAGTATKEAYQKTGQLTGKEFGYGALSGLTEAGIEALSNVVGFGSGTVIKSITNGVGKGTLKGAAKSAAKSVVKSATKEAAESVAKGAAKTAAKTVAKKTLGKELLSGFVGEAFEEGLAEFISPFWARATYDPDAQMATPSEIAYASFVGGLSGMIMSGGNVAVDSGVSFFKGNSINGKGQASEVMGLSDIISKYEAENATGDEDILRVSETYAKLSESLKDTGGAVQTVTQKKLLGDLHRENTAAIFKPAMTASAANAVANADALQVKLAEMGITNADGSAITAEQIRAGVDVNDRKSFGKALKENHALRTVAAMDVAGRLMTDSKRLTDASLRGKALASRVDLARLATEGTPAEKQALSEALGIDDWTKLDADSFNKKIVEFVENGGIERYKQLRELIKNADTLPEADARPMPKFMNMQKDGIRRYSDENSRIAVMKNGDTFRLYDYDSRTVSKELTRTEVNAALREYNTKKNAVTSMNQQNRQVTENVDGSVGTAVATDTNVGGNDITNVTSEKNISKAETVEKSAAELDSIAKDNIPEYSKLSVPSRVMIRKVLHDALAAGYSESDAILSARVSARSGLHMTFSKSLCEVGRIKGTKDFVYADGYYDPYDNHIVINPEGTRSVDALLIHELTHAVYKDKRGRIILERGAKNMSDEQKQSIIKSYSKVAKGSSAVIRDEMNAHYIEGQLKNKNLLEALLSDEPTLKDKILSFFKGASTDYAGNAELSGAAKRLFKRYKKLFDSFSAQNQGTNAYGAAVMNSAVQDAKRNAFPESDAEYLSAVERGDMETAQKMVDEAARAAGYTDKLYHGTKQFGFTEFDPSHSDDKISIFVAGSEDLAQTYSGRYGKKQISDVADVDALSIDKVVERLSQESRDSYEGAELQTEYEVMNSDDIKNLFSSVDGDIERLQDIVEAKIKVYADKLATDFNDSDYKIHKRLFELNRMLEYYLYDEISTPLYMLINHTDVFADNSGVSDIEYKIRLRNKLSRANATDGVVIKKDLDGYGVSVMSFESARQELKNMLAEGNYALYGNPKNQLVIDGKGQNWNDIRHWSNAVHYTKEGTVAERKGEFFRLYDKKTGNEIFHGRLAVNTYSEGLSADMRHLVMIDKANNVIDVRSEYMHTTREIARFAKESGYDSVKFENITDNGGLGESTGSGDVYAYFDPNNLKSADPVTYDDNGNVIPLSERFNPENKDIRFALPEGDAALEELLAERDALESVENSFDAKAIVSKGLPIPTGRENISRGELKKIIANNTADKVYSRSDAMRVVGRFMGVSDLTQKAQAEITDGVWQLLNDSSSYEVRAENAHAMSEFIVAKMINDVLVDNESSAYYEAAERMAFLRSGIGMLSFSKSDISEIKYVLDTKGLKKILGRWQKKKARFTYPMDVFVTDIAREMPGMEYLEEMHPAEAMLEIDSIYSNLRDTLAEKKIPFYLDVTDSEIQYMIDGIESVIMQAYETEGSESKFSRYVDSRIGYYREYAEFYKAKYDQIKGYDRLCGLVASKAQRMKDLKLGTFRNATQAETDTFKKTIMSLSRVNYRGNLNQRGTRKILATLKDWYIPTNPVLMVPDPENLSENTGLYVPGIAEKLSALSSGKTNQFTKEELHDLYDVLSYFVKFVEDYGKVYYRGQMVEALPIAKNFIKIAEENRALKGTAFAVLRKKLSVYADTFFDPASLVRMKDLYNPDGFYTSMFDMLREATMNSDIAEMDVLAPLEVFLESNKKYIESASKDIVDYMGHSIPKIQLIDLYMSMGRRQAHRGIAESGFKFKNLDGETETVRGFLENGTEMSDEEIAKAINRKRAEIFKSFSAADLEYIKILDRVYNEDAKRLKVQRDFERYGFTNAVEDYYYPIRRFAGNTNIDTDAKAELDRVSSASFNKDTVKGAKQMLIIESADSRMRRHVRAVCDYAYLSPAISSFNVLYNLDIGGDPNAPINVKSVTENSWSAGESYIRKLVADIQGIPQGSKEGQVLLGKIRGGYAKFQLGANPKVWFTQGSSLFASSSILDADSITYGASHYGQQTVSDVFKYCRLAELRASDNTAALAQAVLDKDGRALSKVGKIGKGINKVSDALMTPIGKVDEFIIRRLYAACQHQVAKNNGPAIGTVENKKAAGELLTKVILETQQNTMATERSAAMRSNNEVLRTLTMFTSDAMKVVGRVIDGFGELMAVRARIKATTDQKTLAALNAQKKAAGKKLGKAVAALSTSAIYMAALGQLFFWLYGKERDEDEKWWEVFAADSVGNLFGGLPIFSDVYSFFVDGYEIESFTYSSINDLLTSTKQVFDTVGKITSGEATSQDVAKNTRNIIYSIGQMTGLPFRNVYNVFYGATKHLSPETAFNIDNAFYAKNYRNELYKALEKGDDRMVAHIMSLILGERVGNADDVVLSELVAISKAGEKVLPHEIPDEITVNDVEYAISPEQQAGMMQVSSLADKDLKKLFVRSSYKGLSYANKALAVDYIYDLYYDKAVEDVLGIDRKNSALAFIDIIGADVFALLYILTKGLESDKDKDGNTVAGSKRKKVIAAINSLGISTEQKLLLIAAKGYSIADGDIKGVSAANARRRLLKYILSSKISAAKKTEIASLCGFTVKNGKILNDL